jgi:hypothetical protein
MSKKVVSFTLPPNRAKTEPPPVADAGSPPSPHFPDSWVHAPEASANAAKPNPVVIDLSANRSWFELMGLIGIFPYLATTCWLQTAARTWKQP